MIRPTKYLDLKTCVLNVSSTILELLNDFSVIQLSEVDEIIIEKIGDDAKHNIIPALNFGSAEKR